jgi:hypothetical protein
MLACIDACFKGSPAGLPILVNQPWRQGNAGGMASGAAKGAGDSGMVRSGFPVAIVFAGP